MRYPHAEMMWLLFGDVLAGATVRRRDRRDISTVRWQGHQVLQDSDADGESGASARCSPPHTRMCLPLRT
jgi:hypothetical protein